MMRHLGLMRHLSSKSSIIDQTAAFFDSASTTSKPLPMKPIIPEKQKIPAKSKEESNKVTLRKKISEKPKKSSRLKERIQNSSKTTEIKTNAKSYKNIITKALSEGNLALAKEKLKEFNSLDQPNLDRKSTVIMHNSVISAIFKHQKEHSWEDALEIMQKYMKDKVKSPNAITFTSIISGTCKILAGKGNLQKKKKKEMFDTCFEMYQKMIHSEDSDLKPTETSFNAMVDLCIQAKEFKKAQQVIQDMEKEKISPSVITLSLRIKLLGKQELFDQAYELFKSMSTKFNISPDPIAYQTIIGICISQKKLEHAWEILQEKSELHVYKKTSSKKSDLVLQDMPTINSLIREFSYSYIQDHTKITSLERALEIFGFCEAFLDQDHTKEEKYSVIFQDSYLNSSTVEPLLLALAKTNQQKYQEIGRKMLIAALKSSSTLIKDSDFLEGISRFFKYWTFQNEHSRSEFDKELFSVFKVKRTESFGSASFIRNCVKSGFPLLANYLLSLTPLHKLSGIELVSNIMSPNSEENELFSINTILDQYIKQGNIKLITTTLNQFNVENSTRTSGKALQANLETLKLMVGLFRKIHSHQFEYEENLKQVISSVPAFFDFEREIVNPCYEKIIDTLKMIQSIEEQVISSLSDESNDDFLSKKLRAIDFCHELVCFFIETNHFELAIKTLKVSRNLLLLSSAESERNPPILLDFFKDKVFIFFKEFQSVILKQSKGIKWPEKEVEDSEIEKAFTEANKLASLAQIVLNEIEIIDLAKDFEFYELMIEICISTRNFPRALQMLNEAGKLATGTEQNDKLKKFQNQIRKFTRNDLHL